MSKEKQIEELAEILRKVCDATPNGKCMSKLCCACRAETVIEAGYRKQSEVLDDLEDLLIDFDEMGLCPITPVPDPEGYAVEWKRKLVNALQGYRKQIEAEWIRAENPPEEYRDECGELIPFLVCCQGTVYPFRAMYDGANWGDGIGVLKVTHWMPLPEPPEES